MKKNILKISVILLLMTCALSCSKKEELEVETKIEYEEYLEYIDSSFLDMPWLKEIVEERRNTIKAGYLSQSIIYQCTYKNGIGFILDFCVGCPDAGFALVDINGVSVCYSNGWHDSCKEFNIDYENKKLIYEIQPDPPVSIENLYAQSPNVISRSVQGKWILHKFWGGIGNVRYYDWTTLVNISEDRVNVSGNEGVNFTFSYSWKQMGVPPPYPEISSYNTYVMWNDKQNRGEWSFFNLRYDMLEVNLLNSGVYTLIRVRDIEMER